MSMRRVLTPEGVSFTVPQDWTEIAPPPPDVLSAWAVPFVAGVFRTNAVLTEDHVPAATTWERLSVQTWEASSAMLDDARLLEQGWPPQEHGLVRWTHHRVALEPVVLHQVTSRRGTSAFTLSITVPTLALPDSMEILTAIATSFDIDGGAG